MCSYVDSIINQISFNDLADILSSIKQCPLISKAMEKYFSEMTLERDYTAEIEEIRKQAESEKKELENKIEELEGKIEELTGTSKS